MAKRGSVTVKEKGDRGYICKPKKQIGILFSLIGVIIEQFKAAVTNGGPWTTGGL